MSDIVVRLPIRDPDEAAAFGSYLSRFLESVAGEAQRLADRLDAPILMVRDEPQLTGGMRVITFQERGAARAFAGGWRRLRSGPALDA